MNSNSSDLTGSGTHKLTVREKYLQICNNLMVNGTKGRRNYEDSSSGFFRNQFEEDRYRIISCSAFRRLASKTQLFMANEVKKDHIRNRMTHSLEVGCIARYIADGLGLNGSLADVVGTVHDLGHAPFGHSGERILDDIMKNHGSRFFHNEHTFKLITFLSSRLGQNGLNLTWETLDGTLKHNGPLVAARGDLSHYEYINFYNREMANSNPSLEFDLSKFSSLESQCAAIADDISYINHDLEDCISLGMLSLNDLRENDFFNNLITEAEKMASHDDEIGVIKYIKVASSQMFVEDAIFATMNNIVESGVQCTDDVYNCGIQLVGLSPYFNDALEFARNIFREKVYYCEQNKNAEGEKGAKLENIFYWIKDNPHLVDGKSWRLRLESENEPIEGVICDYIACMSDDYVTKFYQKIENQALELI